MGRKKITQMTAGAIARAVARRELSAREVVASHLAVIEQLNPMVNAICTLAEERAMSEAEALDQSLALLDPTPPLAGVPIAIKDIVPTAGIRTTFGSRLMAEFVPSEDAVIVQRLRKAGAIILGKTNVPEFAAGANTKNALFGATRNPWDLGLTAGGSTGGGAAALATSMIALADGSDLGGSIRTPAAFCGVYGLRPTPGLVPQWPSERPWDTLAAGGPMARSMADLALMLSVTAGPLPESPLSVAIAGRDFVAAVDPLRAKKLRVGWCADPVGLGVDPAIAARGSEVGKALREAGAAVEDIELDLAMARPIFFALRAFGMVATHLTRLDKLDRLDAKIGGNVQAGLEQKSVALATAERERAAFRLRLLSYFASRDILLCPTTAVMPFEVDTDYPATVNGRGMENYVEWLAPAFPATLAGLPALSVPCGLSAEGLPIGLQVIGRPHHEEQVLAIGAAVERCFPFAFPPLAVMKSVTHEERHGH